MLIASRGWLPVPERVAFTVFGLDIMWYGICLTTGIVVGFLVIYFKATSRNIDRERILDLFLWTVPCGVVGARVYYCIFEWNNYADNLLKIFDIRSGGLAIHGAIIGGFGVGVLCLLKWKQKPMDWVDLACIGLPIAQAIGRWGNYFNSEAHGVATNLPWAIYADGEWVHPTFLYESVWCFLLFLFLLWFDKKKKKFRGQITCLYCIIYSIERFFVEGLRTDSLYIGSFRQAQVISVCMILGGIIALVILSSNYKNAQKDSVSNQEYFEK